MPTGIDGASLRVMEGNGTKPYLPLRVSHRKMALKRWQTIYPYNEVSFPGRSSTRKNRWTSTVDEVIPGIPGRGAKNRIDEDGLLPRVVVKCPRTGVVQRGTTPNEGGQPDGKVLCASGR